MERQELLNYVKDVYELESQLFSLQEIHEQYRKVYEKLKMDREYICFSEEFTTDTRKKYEQDALFEANMGGDMPMAYPNDYMLIPDEFSKQNFSGTNIGLYLPPRYQKDFFSVVDKLKSNFFTKGKAFDFSPNSKLRKEYQPLYIKRYNEEYDQKQIWIEPIIKNHKEEHDKYVQPNCLQTEKLLKDIYSLNIIHPKYRNLMAIAQIYEYLDTRRCDTLEGPNGAYNLYEQELRQNIIINQLEQVIDKLEELNQSMHYMCQAINKTNTLLTNISNGIGQIVANTACIAYNTQCIAYNTEMAKKYNF